jgi:phosphoglycolate phosphatase-like HAD superfamily hydrolase
MGILTRNGVAIARETLRVCGLDHFFNEPVIIGRESCTPKPNPSGIIHLLDHWNAARGNTVMVGDHLIDMHAGQGAGVKTVHFDHNGGFEQPESADVRVTALVQLIPLCQSVVASEVDT